MGAGGVATVAGIEAAVVAVADTGNTTGSVLATAAVDKNTEVRITKECRMK
jgi:preprotein translocase subunit YajC